MKDADALRAEVARHRGPARTLPLLHLAPRLEHDYWAAGPGQPASAPILDELVDVLDEACGYLQPGTFVRGQVAGQLGAALAARHTIHFGPEQDRERAIPLLEESLTFPALPHLLQVRNRQQLASLLATRALRGLQDPATMMRLVMPGPPPPSAADADRAVTLLREVRDGPVLGSHIAETTELMLEIAETVATLLGGRNGPGGGPAGLDFSRLTDVMSTLANLQQKMAAQPRGAGFGYVPNAFDFSGDDLAATPPQERPVMVVDAPATEGEAVLDPTEAPGPAVPGTAAATYRDALTALLPSPTAVLDLLADGPPDLDTVDELVALGSCLVEAPDAVPADHLPLAVGLYLRGTASGDGWGEPADGADGVADDVKAAATHLLACTEASTAQLGGDVAVALRLADLLDRRVPEHGAGDRLAAAFAPVAAALRAVGADALVVPFCDGWSLLDGATGRFSPAAAELPPRVVVVGDGPLPVGTVTSRVRTAARLVALAARGRRPLTEDAVFVADPRGDRTAAGGDALVLRRTFFPRSTGLGRTLEECRGAGAPDEVSTRLGASLLHLGCGVTADGDLALADGALLTATAIAAEPPARTGGLAVLPPPEDTSDGATAGMAALTDALLASRSTSVIGFREPVDTPIASLVYFVLYTHLVDEGRDPADAVSAVRRWLADPHRTPPEHLPSWYEAILDGGDLSGLAARDALVLHGR